MRISLVNQKGGVGKTTLAVNIAACRGLLMARRVLLIDTDPQGSVLQWQAIQENRTFDVLHRPENLSRRELLGWEKQYDDMVIDSPPATGEYTRKVLSLSDMVIIPIGASPLDIWATRETLEMVSEARSNQPGMLAKLLIYRKIPRTRVGEEIRGAIQDYGLDVFQAEVGQRVAFVEAMIAGLSVIEFSPRSIAATEIQNLCQEIMRKESHGETGKKT